MDKTIATLVELVWQGPRKFWGGLFIACWAVVIFCNQSAPPLGLSVVKPYQGWIFGTAIFLTALLLIEFFIALCPSLSKGLRAILVKHKVRKVFDSLPQSKKDVLWRCFGNGESRHPVQISCGTPEATAAIELSEDGYLDQRQSCCDYFDFSITPQVQDFLRKLKGA
jgi:hypothetical protein